jgi:hypothetical protein
MSELLELLSNDDRQYILKDIQENGYSSINDIYAMVQKNAVLTDFTLLDADLIVMIDLKINYPLFITESQLLTRGRLIEQYNLEKFKIEPEQLFNIQCIEVIDNDYFIFDKETDERHPAKLYNTKIYIGKEKWKDFMVAFRFMRSMSFMTEMRLAITESASEKNKEKNKESKYIETVIEQVLKYDP